MQGIRDDGTFASVFQAATALHGDEIGNASSDSPAAEQVECPGKQRARVLPSRRLSTVHRLLRGGGADERALQ